MRGLAAAGLAALAVLACGRQPEADRAAWTPEDAWHVEVVWTAGGADAEGDLAFGDVRGLAVDGAGRAWVLDFQAQHLVVLDTNGALVRTVGRQGGGPGEFEGLYGVTVTPDQRVWAPDHRNVRYTVFDTSGTLIGTFRRELPCRSFVWPGGATLDGAVRDIACGRSADDRFLRYVVRYDTATRGFRDSLLVPPAQDEPPYYQFDFGDTQTFLPVPFAPEQRWAMAPDDGGVWVGWSGAYDVVRLGPQGDTLRHAHRTFPAVAVSAAERDARVAALRQMARGRDFDTGRIPDVQPYFERLVPDHNGFLWVMRRDATARWVLDVFDTTGTWLGVVQVPDAVQLDTLRPIVIIGNAMWTVSRDALDAPVVTRLRIVGR